MWAAPATGEGCSLGYRYTFLSSQKTVGLAACQPGWLGRNGHYCGDSRADWWAKQPAEAAGAEATGQVNLEGPDPPCLTASLC